MPWVVAAYQAWRNRTIISLNTCQNGLSHNSIVCIWQDHDGFLWLGTKEGLSRYDSYTFTVYKPNPSDPANTFEHNWITDICEDRKGRLWITTLERGLHYFDRQHGKATAYLIEPKNISLRNAMFSAIKDRKGMLSDGFNTHLGWRIVALRYNLVLTIQLVQRF